MLISNSEGELLCVLRFEGLCFSEVYSSILALQPADKRKFTYGGLNAGRPVTPPRGATNKNKKK